MGESDIRDRRACTVTGGRIPTNCSSTAFTVVRGSESSGFSTLCTPALMLSRIGDGMGTAAWPRSTGVRLKMSHFMLRRCSRRDKG